MGQGRLGFGSGGYAARQPLRTCVGCRRVLLRGALLRITRTPDGFVEPDLGRRDNGRGAYLCFREGCLTETLRRGRWAYAFKAPAAMRPETIERLRVLIGEKAEAVVGSNEKYEGGSGVADRRPVHRDGSRAGRAVRQDVRLMGRPGEPAEGGW